MTDDEYIDMTLKPSGEVVKVRADAPERTPHKPEGE